MKSYTLDSASKSDLYAEGPFAQPDLLCFSHLRWNFVTQRPQHLMRRAAHDRRVFFWEEPIFHAASELSACTDAPHGMHLEIIEETSSLYVVRPHLAFGCDIESAQRTLLEDLMVRFSIDHLVRWYYTPMSLSFSSHLKAAATVYDCMDELTGFLGAPPDLAARERQLFSLADVVFTGGISLFEAKKHQHQNIHPFPSSIEVEHFKSARNASILEPEDQASIPHPRAGFYGVLDERLDLTLLDQVAQLRPDVHFIILGPIAKIAEETLPRASNIHYLGAKEYADLPAYLAGWDAALLLFALNPATRYISPTKTPEYLAAGKSVVSTPIHDVVQEYGRHSLVAIAATPAEFALALDHALVAQTDAWKQAVTAKLAQNSWDITWAKMQHHLDLAIADKLAGTAQTLDTASTVSITKWTHAPRTPYRQSDRYDYLVVGAGFAGAVLAERIASQLGKRVLVIDKREHVAGNAYDFVNQDGILVHQYGPHIFHTNSDKVVDYLSRFTEWRPYEHRVLSSVDGHLLPVPINLDTINHLYGLSLDADGMKSFLDARVITPAQIRTSEDVVMSRVGRELYEKFFRNYTRKQWGLDPSQLDASVAGRIPVRFDRDDRYFTDTFQAMPLDGYTRMFERMLDHPRITVKTGVDFRDMLKTGSQAKIVYTGPIDEYFNFKFGPLPYRSLKFVHEIHNQQQFQSAPVVNYPNDQDYTRITEFKYLTGQRHRKTSIVYEYPMESGDPYYPIPRPENAALYAKYLDLSSQQSNLFFCGRLASYRYLNMDQVVAQALHTFKDIEMKEPARLPVTLNTARIHESFATTAAQQTRVEL